MNKDKIQIDVADLAEWYLAHVSRFILDNFDLYKTHPTKTDEISLVVGALYDRDPIRIQNVLATIFPMDLYMKNEPDPKNSIQIQIMDGYNLITTSNY